MEVITKDSNTVKIVETLLKKAADIKKKYDTIAQATGSNFNIFELINVADDEVRMCRVLADLLNPNGTHRQGRIYLDLFFDIVLGIKRPNTNHIEIKREDVIDNNRRIDIVIKYDKNIIPIEVKINAGDQHNQLYDYAQKSKGSGIPKVYYLTKFGTRPSYESCCNSLKNKQLKDDDICCISWSQDILKWLNVCLSHYNSYTKASIREILIQFIAVIRKFTEQLEENEKMEIQELLLKTPENMKSANDIAIALDSLKIDLLEKFRSKLEANLTEKIKKPDEVNGNRNSWNLGYKLSSIDGNIRVVRISYENKAVRKLLQILSNDWKTYYKTEETNEIFSLSNDSFYELVIDEQLNIIIQDCTKWIADKLNDTTKS
ncbi:MAG: PD-(D/E)XK nuclease family protein [Candidatus Gastranaerophilales bacterium]|nr:PD-(D/E)XK nuclease family protein [Candidatus Gastranaerophilales bacterium]